MSQVIDAAAKLSEAEDAVTAPLADSHIVTFADGVTIGTVLYTEAELRELTARDLIDAQEASEKVVRSRDAVTLDLLSSLHEGESLESRGRDAGGDA